MPQGRILIVDLTSGKIAEEAPDPRIYQDFLGGYGLAVRLIYERQEPKFDPLSPQSWLALCPGLLCGSGFPLASRCALAAKSPLTGTWGDANFGGYMGREVKRAGYDGIFVHGQAARPVYLWVKDGQAQLRSAEHLWGKDTYETQELLKQELGDSRIAVACIGPAGERGSLIASVIHNQGRAAARSGLGAVMAAKGLKAIAVRGTEPVAVAQPAVMEALSRPLWRRLDPSPSLMGRIAQAFSPLYPWVGKLGLARFLRSRVPSNVMASLFHRYGTTLGLATLISMGDTPIKNWGGGVGDFPTSRAKKISDQAVVSRLSQDYGCADCPVRCGGLINGYRRPEYQALAALGPLLLNDDLETIIRAYDLCNRAGLDAIEVGTAIAWAIECFQAGLITEKDTQGRTLNWGDKEAILGLANMIAQGRGIGGLLAQGVAKASQALGPKAQEYAVHIRGQAPGMHHPAANPYYGLAYIADPTPGRHTAGNASVAEAWGQRFPLEGITLPSTEAGLHALWSHYTQVLTSAGCCLFSLSLGGLPLLEAMEAATGWKYSAQELLQVGERIQNLRQLFNLREGADPAHLRLPPRLREQAPDLEKLRQEYFQTLGWDSRGRPSLAKLKELRLDSLALPSPS